MAGLLPGTALLAQPHYKKESCRARGTTKLSMALLQLLLLLGGHSGKDTARERGAFSPRPRAPHLLSMALVNVDLFIVVGHFPWGALNLLASQLSVLA